jgi:BlaI family transcriptional regulator, penicillinase repressor
MNEAAPPELHELESEIMDTVWDRGEVTVRDVLDAINDRADRERAYNTVMTVMTRLCTKGVLRRERRGRRDHYVSTLSRERYRDARAGSQADTLVEQYGDLALAHFAAHVERLDPGRREQLRRLAGGD